jgi:hypothetical protein
MSLNEQDNNMPTLDELNEQTGIMLDEELRASWFALFNTELWEETYHDEAVEHSWDLFENLQHTSDSSRVFDRTSGNQIFLLVF